ncbi:hypothetical protein CEXT_750561 [Caerostris extrusa]|uniref:Maturase K n=1 Tax=Caerostris extrusa TaxID=172846 RepID=A0AAV4TQJ1_CAEEX|nr:hypothetical protein CEXT_750561 [Caerostris extrusa]
MSFNQSRGPHFKPNQIHATINIHKSLVATSPLFHTRVSDIFFRDAPSAFEEGPLLEMVFTACRLHLPHSWVMWSPWQRSPRQRARGLPKLIIYEGGQSSGGRVRRIRPFVMRKSISSSLEDGFFFLPCLLFRKAFVFGKMKLYLPQRISGLDRIASLLEFVAVLELHLDNKTMLL